MSRSRENPVQTATLAIACLAWAAVLALALFGPVVASTGAFWRLAQGAKSLLSVVVPAAAMALLAGVPMGLVAARVGRLGDRLVTRSLEIVGGFPTIVLVALLRASFPNAPLWLVAATLGLVRVPETARLARLYAVRYRTSEQFVATRALGASSTRILFRHLLPSMAAALASSALVSLGILVGVDASMTFVGLGTPIPGPSWGDDIGLALSAGHVGSAWLPALALAVTLLATYRLAESVRTKFEERKR